MLDTVQPTNQLIAIVGIAGTLCGALGVSVINAIMTRSLQRKEHEHEDAARLRDIRIQTYAAFNDSASTVAAKMGTDGSWPEKDATAYFTQYQMLILVGGKGVRAAAARVHELFPDEERATITVDDDAFNSALKMLTKAMRDEINGASTEITTT